MRRGAGIGPAGGEDRFSVMAIDFGFVAACVLIGLLVYLVVRGGRRPGRAFFKRAGFEALPVEGGELISAAEAMVGLPAVELHSGRHAGCDLFVVELDSGNSDDPNLTLLLFELPQAVESEIAVFHTKANLPRLLRRVTGGFFSRLQPVGDPAFANFAGNGWALYGTEGQVEEPGMARALCQATQMPESPFLIAVAVSGRYLGVWGSRFFLRHLLAAGPKSGRIGGVGWPGRGAGPGGTLRLWRGRWRESASFQ